MQPLSQDLRMRIVAARENGHGAGATSRRFRVSRRSVERLWNQHNRQGHVRPKRIGGYRRSRLEGHDRRLGRWIAAEPGLTLAQLQERCRTQLGVRVRQTALWHRLNWLGLTYKKNAARRRAGPTRR